MQPTPAATFDVLVVRTYYSMVRGNTLPCFKLTVKALYPAKGGECYELYLKATFWDTEAKTLAGLDMQENQWVRIIGYPKIETYTNREGEEKKDLIIHQPRFDMDYYYRALGAAAATATPAEDDEELDFGF